MIAAGPFRAAHPPARDLRFVNGRRDPIFWPANWSRTSSGPGADPGLPDAGPRGPAQSRRAALKTPIYRSPDCPYVGMPWVGHFPRSPRERATSSPMTPAPGPGNGSTLLIPERSRTYRRHPPTFTPDDALERCSCVFVPSRSGVRSSP